MSSIALGTIPYLSYSGVVETEVGAQITVNLENCGIEKAAFFLEILYNLLGLMHISVSYLTYFDTTGFPN